MSTDIQKWIEQHRQAMQLANNQRTTLAEVAKVKTSNIHLPIPRRTELKVGVLKSEAITKPL